MASQAEGHVFKSRHATLNFSKLMFEIAFEIYHDLYGEEKHREKTCPAKYLNFICEVPDPHSAHAGTVAQAISH